MAQRTIGVAMDFSPSSKHALRWALENMAKTGDHVIIVHVVKSDLEDGKSALWEANGSPLIPLCDMGDKHVMAGYGVESDPEVIALLELQAREKQLCVVGKVFYGDAREKLCDAINDIPLHSLVMGSRGLSPLKRALLGSVSNYVVNNAPCPVTVVKLACP